MKLPFLPYARQYIDDDDAEAVANVLKSDYLTTGPMVERYETAFSQAVGSDFAVACNSGTAALHLALMALSIGPGSTVLVPAVTFIATANVARYVGADVEFIDVHAKTGLIDVEKLKHRLETGSKVDVVMPVYLAGQCQDPEVIWNLSQHYDFTIIEDACHAIGTTYGAHNDRVGACQHAHLSAFSTHAVKTIATGEGGMVTTADQKLAQKMKDLRSHGMTRNPDLFINKELSFGTDGSVNPWYYEMQSLGYNYRLPDINCALGISQLKKLPMFCDKRKHLANIYDRAFKNFSYTMRPIHHIENCQPVWHLYVLLIDFVALNTTRAQVMMDLKNQGIGSQVHYIPVPFQPFYKKTHQPDQFPGALEYYNSTLSIPLFPAMSDDDAMRVVQSLRQFIT